MLYNEIIAVCSQIHTKHINTLCGQNVELMNVKLVVHIVTAGLWRVKYVPVPLFLFWSLPQLQTFWLSTTNTQCGIYANFWGGSNSSIIEYMHGANIFMSWQTFKKQETYVNIFVLY
jgi:hypothetical protein